MPDMNTLFAITKKEGMCYARTFLWLIMRTANGQKVVWVTMGVIGSLSRLSGRWTSKVRPPQDSLRGLCALR